MTDDKISINVDVSLLQNKKGIKSLLDTGVLNKKAFWEVASEALLSDAAVEAATKSNLHGCASSDGRCHITEDMKKAIQAAIKSVEQKEEKVKQ